MKKEIKRNIYWISLSIITTTILFYIVENLLDFLSWYIRLLLVIIPIIPFTALWKGLFDKII